MQNRFGASVRSRPRWVTRCEFVGSSPAMFRRYAEKRITVSMGVAVSECIGKDEAEALLSRADASLYAAKGNGRNRVEYFGSAPQEATCPADSEEITAAQGNPSSTTVQP